MPKWLFNLASELRNQFEFTFIATHSGYVIPEYRKVASVAVLPFNKWMLASFLLAKRIDIAQVANLRLYTEAALLARVPVIIERVDGLRGGAALADKAGLDAVIASTRVVLPELQQLIDPQRIHVIYNGVDLSSYNVVPERFGFAPEDVIVGRTSRLSGGKNISLLIKAVIALRRDVNYRKVRLVICGADTTQLGALPMRARLQKEAEPLGKNVVFTGEVLNTTAITAGYDIATCTSMPNNEGIPNSLIEAMAAGKPVVATEVDGIPELVENGRTGLLLPSDNLEKLKLALSKLIDNRALRLQMGLAAKQRVEDHFEIKAQAKKYADLYSDLIVRKGRHPLNRFALASHRGVSL